MNKPFIIYPLDLDTVLTLVSLQLVAHGLYVAQSFEIDSSCASFTQDTCPHHGKGPCECRLSVLQVYDKGLESLHLIIHEFDGKAEFYFGRGDSSDHPDLEICVKRILQEERSIVSSFSNT